MGRKQSFSLKAQKRAVQLFLRQRFAHSSEAEAIHAIAEQVGCAQVALAGWVRASTGDERDIPETEDGMRQRIEELKREQSELELRLEILRTAVSLRDNGKFDRPNF